MFSINSLRVEVKYCNEIGDLQVFLESPECKAITLVVPNFSSEYANIQNTSQQKIPLLEFLKIPLLKITTTLQIHHVDFPLKRRGKDRFHVVSTWNPRGVCRAYAYSIGKLVFPPLFDEVNNTMSQNLIQKSIEKDIAWAMAEGLPEKEKPMPLLGS